VLRRLLEEWPQIKAPRVTELLREEYGYGGSVDLVKRRLRELRPSSVGSASAPARRSSPFHDPMPPGHYKPTHPGARLSEQQSET
jgi:hypothetical protein